EVEQLIEDQLANEASENEDFDLNFAFVVLDAYRKRPLDLNKATADELAELPFFNDIQVSQLLEYRQRMNGFLNQYELQVIPGLDLETIRAALPYLRVGGGIDDLKVPLGRMVREGDREVFIRWNRNLEKARGFLEDAYQGDPNQYYVRFRQRYSNKLSFGVTMEKDPGEPFFNGANANQGFDYYSAHFYLRDVNKTLKAIALGDFTVNFGQGLILYTGFGAGKSALVTNVRRSGRTIKPYGSVNEALFMRGAAATIGIGDRMELTAFGSRRGRDANLLDVDTLEVDGEIPLAGVSSLDQDGLHRTTAELEDRNAVTQTSVGGSLRYRFPANRGKVGVNVLSENLSRPLNLTEQPYNRFFFQGTQLTNASVDYSYRLRNLTFFGEVAVSDNGGQAHLHGLLAGLDRFCNLAIVYRNYGRDYQALNARPFAETNGGRNEEGLYFGLELAPANHWILAAYYDIFRHPWLRFNTDGPTTGNEWRIRLTYWQKRKLETYLEVRNESKGVGIDLFDNPVDGIVTRDRFQARLHFAYRITKAFEWRNRLDWGFTNTELNDRQTGFMVYQDFIYRPIGFPLSFTSRIAFFNTDSYQVRFYNYENGLLYNFRIPAYYGRGSPDYLYR
ncbi:MAG: helix-hairpin-helix domain-containing protein, partial [Bacteroidota bacterium]